MNSYEGALAGETKWSYIRALQCALHGCLLKATAMRPNTISFCCTVATRRKTMASFLSRKYAHFLCVKSLECYLALTLPGNFIA